MFDSVTPWTVAHQAPPPMEFSRQEYWSGSPFPSPGDLPCPGIEPRSPALQADALPSEPPGKPVRAREMQKELAVAHTITPPTGKLTLQLCRKPNGLGLFKPERKVLLLKKITNHQRLLKVSLNPPNVSQGFGHALVFPFSLRGIVTSSCFKERTEPVLGKS